MAAVVSASTRRSRKSFDSWSDSSEAHSSSSSHSSSSNYASPLQEHLSVDLSPSTSTAAAAVEGTKNQTVTGLLQTAPTDELMIAMSEFAKAWRVVGKILVGDKVVGTGFVVKYRSVNCLITLFQTIRSVDVAKVATVVFYDRNEEKTITRLLPDELFEQSLSDFDLNFTMVALDTRRLGIDIEYTPPLREGDTVFAVAFNSAGGRSLGIGKVVNVIGTSFEFTGIFGSEFGGAPMCLKDGVVGLCGLMSKGKARRGTLMASITEFIDMYSRLPATTRIDKLGTLVIPNIEGKYCFVTSENQGWSSIESAIYIYDQKQVSFKIKGDHWSGGGMLSANGATGIYTWEDHREGNCGSTSFVMLDFDTMVGTVTPTDRSTWKFKAVRLHDAEQI